MEIKSKSHNILKGYNMLLYFAGSMIMYEPNEECIVDFWQQGILNRLPVASPNPNFTKAASQLRDSCADRSLCLTNLKNDYSRLFANPDIALAPAFESKYHNNGSGMTDKSSATEFYESYGWVSKYKGKIDDDHLAIELLFLTLLVDKYLLLDDQACVSEMRGEICRFIDQHLLSWISSWNDRMQEHSRTLCYKGIATLILACIEDIHALCGKQTMQRQHDYLRN